MTTGGTAKSFPKVFVWVLLSTLVISAMLLQAGLVERLDSDAENMTSEADGLYGLRCVQLGQPLYYNFSKPPHILTQYTPLFYLIPGLLARAVKATDLQSFLIGRTVTWCCWFSIAALIYALARQGGCGPLFALSGAFLWLSGELATAWAISFRPDAAALMCSLAAVLVYQRRAADGRWLWLVLALLVVAFLHKQSAVCAWVVLVWEECSARRFTRAAVLSAGWAIALATTVCVANRMTQGAFVLNVFRSTAMPDLDRQPLYVLAALVAGAGVLAGGSLACLLPGACERLFKRYFVLALLLAVVSAGKAGANVNYFLEPFAVGCLLVSFLLQNSAMSLATPKTTIAFLAGLGLLLGSALGVMLGRLNRFPGHWRQMACHHESRLAQAEAWRNVLSRFDDVKGPILIENPYLALRRGLPPYLLNPANFSGMQVGGTFDDTTLVRLIETGQFEIIVTDSSLTATAKRRGFPLCWLSAIENQYSLTEVVSGFYIYRPKRPRSPARDPLVPAKAMKD